MCRDRIHFYPHVDGYYFSPAYVDPGAAPDCNRCAYPYSCSDNYISTPAYVDTHAGTRTNIRADAYFHRGAYSHAHAHTDPCAYPNSSTDRYPPPRPLRADTCPRWC